MAQRLDLEAVRVLEPVEDEDVPSLDPDDPRLQAFFEAVACAIVDDMVKNPSR